MFYFNTDNLEKNKNEDTYDNNLQIFKDSLENSLNLMNCISLNDSLNINTAHFSQISDNRTPNKQDVTTEIEECSTEEKTKFSNNLKELRKSFVVKKSNSQIQFNMTNRTSPTSGMNSKNDFEETVKITYKFLPKFQIEEADKKLTLIPEKIVDVKSKSQFKQEKYFWFGAYDKLINTKNMNKILNYYNDDITKDKEKDIFSKNIIGKEQPIVLKDFEIYFDNNTEFNYAKPFIRQKKVFKFY
jgi:hypothetical protein